MTNPRFMLIVATDVAGEMEEEFNKWYDNEHIPGLLKVPGVLNAQRYISVNGSPKYFAIYEHENEYVQEKEEYKKILNTDWTKRIRPHLKHFKRFFLKRYEG
jgi:hypothetical protein